MTRDAYTAAVLGLSEQEMAVALLLAAGSEQDQAVCERLIGRMRDARRDEAARRPLAAEPGPELPRRGMPPSGTPAAGVPARQDRPVMMP